MALLDHILKRQHIDTICVDGMPTPAAFGSIEHEVAAIRTSVALSSMDHVCMTAIEGKDALTFVDRICPRFLYMNPNRIKQTVFINEEGRYITDAYLCRSGDSYLLLCRGAAPDEFARWLSSLIAGTEDVSLRSLNETHSLIALNGPFSWELMADIYDPEIIGLPYLSFYRPSEKVLVFRAGETGEYGYLVAAPHGEAAERWEQMLAEGERYDLACAGHQAIEYCMLENNFFNIHKEGAFEATPAELQIQWRVSYRKSFLFADRLKAMRAKPLAARITAVHSAQPLYESQRLFCDGEEAPIGTVVNAHRFLSGPGHIGLAMIEPPYAVSGCDFYHTNDGRGETAVSTVSPPFVNNRSLYVDPQVHSFCDRDGIVFPPLCTVPMEAGKEA